MRQGRVANAPLLPMGHFLYGADGPGVFHTPLNSLNVARRSLENEQYEIITVLHNESDTPSGSAELATRQYLLLADQIANTGLTVRHLANLRFHHLLYNLLLKESLMERLVLGEIEQLPCFLK